QGQAVLLRPALVGLDQRAAPGGRARLPQAEGDQGRARLGAEEDRRSPQGQPDVGGRPVPAQTARPPPRRPAGPRSIATQEGIWAYLFLLPALLGLIVFTAGPLLVALGLSLTKYEITTPPAWVGLDNYVRLLGDDQMGNAVKNTSYYALLVVPSVIAAALG